MSLVQKVREEEAIALKEKARMERQAFNQEIEMKNDKLDHVEDILLKSDERMNDKLNVIKADYRRFLDVVHVFDRHSLLLSLQTVWT